MNLNLDIRPSSNGGVCVLNMETCLFLNMEVVLCNNCDIAIIVSLI